MIKYARGKFIMSPDFKNITYKYKPTLELTENELKACSELYSKHYGVYTKDSPMNPGRQVHFPVSMYKEHYQKQNFYVALAYDKTKLIAQAFYIRKSITKRKQVYFIFQLVVNKEYRRHGIATHLMTSIWGFSNCYAWGLVTPNIRTVKTLESATYRKCTPSIIAEHLKDIKKISQELFFIDNNKINVDAEHSIVNTNFYVERNLDPKKDYGKWLLGDLPAGYEWLAFTFKEQQMDIKKYKSMFPNIIKFSEENLKIAYGRMRKKTQQWTKGHAKECNYILEKLNINKPINIIDIGCGIGRHSIELAKKGHFITAIDFTKQNISYAKKVRKKSNIKNIRFYCSDIRKFKTTKKYDLALCLYDVIGSFPNKADNIAIIKKAYNILNKNGYFILSVMNFELTEHIVPESQKVNLLEHPEALMNLEPSKDMMTTGNIFNPKYLIIDTKTDLIYRKEQFTSYRWYYLPAEYVICDKRYTMKEISKILKEQGFKIIEKKFVQAGKFDIELTNTNPFAKEILLICQKV